MTITSTDIERQVRTFLDAAGDEGQGFDESAITTDIIAEHGLVDIDTIDQDTFAEIVARYAPEA